MKDDEIKEKKTKRIIEKIEGLATYVTIPRELAIYNVNIDSQEAKLLIDYITNLRKGKEDYKSRVEKANKELINSKEYQIAIAMELNAKQSILIKLDNTLNGKE